MSRLEKVIGRNADFMEVKKDFFSSEQKSLLMVTSKHVNGTDNILNIRTHLV